MTGKIFRSTILVAAVVLLCSLGIVMGYLYTYFDSVQLTQLKDELRIAGIATEQNGIRFLEIVDSDRFRLTWIGADGSVLYDTHAQAQDMTSHADREEVREALESGFGSSSRQSETLLEKTVYEARRLNDGTVLRISVSQSTIANLAAGMATPLIVVAAIAIILSAVLAMQVSQRIVGPLNTLDLEHPLENKTYSELSPLLERINRQHIQITAQLNTLKQKTDEFEQIIGHMGEGLLLLDKDRTVLSINPAAKRMFGIHSDSIGNHLAQVVHNTELESAVETAFSAGRSEVRICRDGREHSIVLSRIESEGTVIGAVLLAFDVTEQISAERSRREFSANVSHELKTPLQSIIGSAELLENKLVKGEDVPRFIGHIHKEASRLILLVEDIIRLSRLDEGVDLPREEIDLFNLAQEAAAGLEIAAAQKNLDFRITGEHCYVNGVRGLLYEIIHNLCDNAVKYNVEGGKVCVDIRRQDGRGLLSVSDTGIGIAPEHHSRIFERFYRVDKSHSRQSGGTGLGLSIVKHAVQYHNAEMNMESAPGKGTTITIRF